MGRPKVPQTAAEARDAILQERQRAADSLKALEDREHALVVQEDQRRGALLRTALEGEQGPHTAELRRLLAPLVGPRDAYLFGLASEDHGRRPRASAPAVKNAVENGGEGRR
jgi:hypothetical protein